MDINHLKYPYCPECMVSLRLFEGEANIQQRVRADIQNVNHKMNQMDFINLPSIIMKSFEIFKIRFQFAYAKSSRGLKGALGEFGITSSMLERSITTQALKFAFEAFANALRPFFAPLELGILFKLYFAKQFEEAVD